MLISNNVETSKKLSLKNTIRIHFDRPYKIIEFIVLQLFYIFLAVILTGPFISNDYKQIIGQFHVFIAVYLAYRFRFFGLSIVLTFNLLEFGFILAACLKEPNYSIYAGLTAKSLTIITSIVLAALSNIQESQKKKLQEQKNQLELLSVTDDLTGVYNHRYFNTILDAEIKKSGLLKESIGLIIIDIDNFKMCNDTNGHDYGDAILKGTATIIKETVGDGNIVCRYGGDEFAVVLPGIDLDTANGIAHKVRIAYEEQKSGYFKENAYNHITLSMGLSLYPNIAQNKDDLISQADMALYHSKNLGKNKIHFYQDVLLMLKKSISSDHQHMIGIFRTLLSTISAKDKYTLGHSERVSQYAVLIGKALSMNLKEISLLQYAGLLHDIGKIEVPKLILSKSGILSEEEFHIVKQHPLYSANILEPLNSMNQLIDYVIHHHERFDGLGYPHGLRGKSISLGARILCVADSFDAMISERPYSKSMDMNEAFSELQRHSGSQFDPDIVNVFIDIMRKEEYRDVV